LPNLKKEIPSKIIYEDDDFFAIHDIQRTSAWVHVSVNQKKRLRHLEDIPEEDTALLWENYSHCTHYVRIS
jgi:diadenosine tetraphosphate (Ap4A) HIT family hydrolase